MLILPWKKGGGYEDILLQLKAESIKVFIEIVKWVVGAKRDKLPVRYMWNSDSDDFT